MNDLTAAWVHCANRSISIGRCGAQSRPHGHAHAAWRLLIGLVYLGALAGAVSRANTIVEFNTSLGNVDVELYDNAAPLTVVNFLQYVNGGSYTNTIIHRSAVSPVKFVEQGGGFTDQFDAPSGTFSAIKTVAPVKNEFLNSSVRGTIAMAKLGGDPDSATSQWFFNLSDNSSNLDNQNGGFTVFGRVVGDGMSVVDAMANLPTFHFPQPFDSLPLRNYSQSDFNAGIAPTPANNLVEINSVSVVGSYNPVWQNPSGRFQVAARGYASPLDALLVINNVSANGAHVLPSDFVGPIYYDVNGDDFLSLDDARSVINTLNQVTSAVAPALALPTMPVPEPAGLVGAASGLVCLLLWSKACRIKE